MRTLGIVMKSGLAACLACLSAASAGAQVICEHATIAPPRGGSLSDRIVLDDDLALFGHRFGPSLAVQTGAVYAFRYDGTDWQEEATLLASDGEFGDWFGIDVALDGDVALVGAVADEDGGSAYIFRYDGRSWFEETKLLPSGGVDVDWFGGNLALDSDVAVVSASQQDEARGAVYVYRCDGELWTQEAMLLAPRPEPFDFFGATVLVRGNLLFVAATSDDDNGTNTGAVYVYHYEGSWSLVETLDASDGAEGDFFGQSLSLSGDRLMIGSRSDDHGNASGSVYVFEFDGVSWVEQTKIVPTDGAELDFFGEWVSLVGDVAVVSARLSDANGLDSGAAYLFRFDGLGWEESKLLPSLPQSGNQFGNEVATNGLVALVGGGADDLAYVFPTDSSTLGCGNLCTQPDCNGNGVLDECDIESGESLDANDNGLPDECECLPDIDGSGAADTTDLLLLLSAWGPVGPGHPADLNGDAQVGTADLLMLLAGWGPCSTP